jgi:ABC-type glycerol-3-phosphate transport system substrate-binding protein
MQPECRCPWADFCPASVLGPRALPGVVAIIGVALLTGCPRVNVPVPPPPFAGISIKVAAPSGVPTEVFERLGQAWASRHQVKLEILRPESIDGSADIRVFSPADMGRLVSAQRLAPLNELPRDRGTTLDSHGFLRAYSTTLMMWNDKIYAVPLVGDSSFGVYRRDLFADPNHQQGYRTLKTANLPSRGPSTWQEVQHVADYFAKALGKPSLPPIPSGADALDREFFSVAGTFVRRAMTRQEFDERKTAAEEGLAFHFDLGTGNPRIAGPGVQAALDWFRAVQGFRKVGTGRPAEAFAAGEAVFALVTLADLAELQSANCPVRGKFAICRVPGSAVVIDPKTGSPAPSSDPAGNFVPYLGSGGWLAGIEPTSAHPAAALDLLCYLSGPLVSLEICFNPDWGGGPTRFSAFEPAARSNWFSYNLGEETTDQLIVAISQAVSPQIVNPVYRLRLADEREYRDDLLGQVKTAIEGKQEVSDALREVDRLWRIRGQGKDMKSLYRLSVGLRQGN